MSDVIEKIEETEVTELETIHDHYEHLRLIVDSMESDALKSSKGNKAAGVRLRKSLRHAKSYLGEFVKFTLGKS
jgi:hypothetical protein